MTQMLKDKANLVENLFSRIAKKYDLLNDLMTLSYHKEWKAKLVKDALNVSSNRLQLRVLDLCTGTGDIAALWIKEDNVVEVIGLDSCLPMLETGFHKLNQYYKGNPPKLKMLQGDALDLPFPHEYFDIVSVGFGLRNVKDLKLSLNEIYRVLKPCGILASLDLGHPSLPFIDYFYKKIFLPIIPILGSSFAKDKQAYKYLVDSLETWPSQKQLSQIMFDIGFKRSYYEDLVLGALAIVIAEK